MVGPDDRGDAGGAELVGRRIGIHGRHDDDRAAPIPFAGEAQHLLGGRRLGMDQNGVGAGLAIGFGAAQRLVEPPSGDQRLDARHDRKIVVGLTVLARLDLAAELVDLGERLALADEGVGLGEQLVLDAHAGDLSLAQLLHQPTHVVEVAIAGVAVHQDRNVGGVRHELEHIEHLRPRRLVGIAHAERGRHRKPGCPDAAEARFFDDLGGKPVMGFHQERKLRREQLGAQGGSPRERLQFRRGSVPRSACLCGWQAFKSRRHGSPSYGAITSWNRNRPGGVLSRSPIIQAPA